MLSRTVQAGPLVSAVANGYAQSQSGTANVALTLNGSLVSGGVGAPDRARRLIITSAGNDSGITFLITGRTVRNGPILTETLTGANIGAATNAQGQAYSALDYATVISIVPSGNTAGTVTAGTNTICSSPWIRLDSFGFAPIALQVIVAGTVNYTVEQAERGPTEIIGGVNYGGITPLTPAQIAWGQHPNLNGATVNGFDTYTIVPEFVRCTLNSGTGSCVFTAGQPANLWRL